MVLALERSRAALQEPFSATALAPGLQDGTLWALPSRTLTLAELPVLAESERRS